MLASCQWSPMGLARGGRAAAWSMSSARFIFQLGDDDDDDGSGGSGEADDAVSRVQSWPLLCIVWRGLLRGLLFR